MREQFEKLPDVKDILDDHANIYFNQECDMYAAKKVISDESVSYPSWEVTYLNGAWYAFQEQQKKIDAVLQYLDTGDHPLDFSANTIRELLK